MVGDKGDTSKKQQHQQISSSSKQQNEESSSQQQQQQVVVPVPFISTPLYVSTSSTFEQQFETTLNTTKRPKYTGQWKLLPSPSQQKQPQITITESKSTTPSPSNPQNQTLSSDTASSPSQDHLSPTLPSHHHEGNKQELDQQVHQQLRKGKFVSPVWKPNEMLWLARAWKEQYQTTSDSKTEQQHQQTELGISRGKTRADKDKEVAEFLNKHGVNRDAKTAGTKWDNMLGEFRKVYEWERGGEREQVGKSYFRLSPYERKLHRLPASFDEEVFEELSLFMGSRLSSSSHGGRVGSSFDETRTRSLPPPRPFKDDELPLSARSKQLAMTSGVNQQFFHGNRDILGFDSLLEISTSSKELRRIGKIKMTWEESVSLWREEGEVDRGRVRLQNSSFLNADELICFDDAMVICPLESFEDGPFRGFSVDRFVSGQQIKVVGRRKSSSISSGFGERAQPLNKPIPLRSIVSLDFRDPTEYYIDCLLRVSSSQSLPTLFELKHHLQEPPPQNLRFPLRKEVFDDLPQGKDFFFTTTSEPLDCRSMIYDIVGPIIRTNKNNNNNNPSSATTLPFSSRNSFISLWDDCVNRVVSRFVHDEMVITRKPISYLSSETQLQVSLQDEWPNVCGFVNNFCLWRGEECGEEIKNPNHRNPSSTIIQKLLWSYFDLPYILGYYAIGNKVTFCALSKSQENDGTKIVRTDLHQVNLTTPSEKFKALVPCFRIGVLLTMLNKHCSKIMEKGNFVYSDFERYSFGHGVIIEMTPNTCTRVFSEKRKFCSVKEVYEILDHRIPHSEFLAKVVENDMSLVFKPRGIRVKPLNVEELVEALKYVTKALVALHDLSFMHRDLGWEKVMMRNDRVGEWFVCGFDEAAGAPELNKWVRVEGVVERGRHAPEMERGLHGVKVDVWSVGYLIMTCGIVGLPKMLRELQGWCMEVNPEQRPTAADCYHHLLQLQSSLVAGGASAGVLM